MKGKRGDKIIGIIICTIIGIFLLTCGSVPQGIGVIIFGLIVFIPQIIYIDECMTKNDEWRNKL